MVAVRSMEEKMRVLSQSELTRRSRLEFTTLLRRIASRIGLRVEFLVEDDETRFLVLADLGAKFKPLLVRGPQGC